MDLQMVDVMVVYEKWSLQINAQNSEQIFYTHVQCLNKKLSFQYKLFWANTNFYVCDN